MKSRLDKWRCCNVRVREDSTYDGFRNGLADGVDLGGVSTTTYSHSDVDVRYQDGQYTFSIFIPIFICNSYRSQFNPVPHAMPPALTLLASTHLISQRSI